MTITKDQALAEIRRLMAEHSIGINDLTARKAKPTSGHSDMPKVFAYLGGTLILAGLVAYIGMQWNHLDSFLRVAVTLGPGLLALGAALTLTLQKGRDDQMAAITPLFALAALFQGWGLYVFLQEYAGNNPVLHNLITSAILGAQFWFLFWQFRRTALMLLAFAFSLSFFLSSISGWDTFSSFLRVTVSLGPGLILLTMAFLPGIQDISKNAKKSIIPVLLSLSALFQTAGLFIFLDEYGGDGDPALATLMVTSIMGVQFLALFWRDPRPVLLFFLLIFAHGFFASAFDLLDISPRYSAFILGLSGLLISSALLRTPYASITPLCTFISGYTFAAASCVILEGTPFDVLLVGIAGLMIYGSVVTRSRMFLFVAVTSLLGYLGYYTDAYFKDMVGWPIALITFGLILIVASHYAVQLGRRFTTQHD